MKEQLGNQPTPRPDAAQPNHASQPAAGAFIPDDLDGGNFGNPVHDSTHIQYTGEAQRPRTQDVAEIYGIFQTGGFLSPKGAEYIRGLREALSNVTIGKQPIKITQLPLPASSLAIQCGMWVIILTFDEAIPREHANLPSVAYTSQAFASARALLGKDIAFYNHQIVGPESYDEVYRNVMASRIINMFKAAESDRVKAMNIHAFKDYNLEVSYSLDRYESFERQHNPHAIRPRAAITMTVRAVKRNQHSRNPHHEDFYETTSSTSFDIGTIGAYVDFTENDDRAKGHFCYQPMVHVNLNAAIPDIASIAILLAVAKTHLIDGGNWLMPFRALSPDMPNIGNLVSNMQDGSPFVVESMEMLNGHVRENIHPPVLLLDIIEGCSCIPGLENLTMQGGNSELVEVFNQFLPELNMPLDAIIGNLAYIEYTGTITVGGTKVDSSNADYLNLMLNYKNRRDEVRELLQVFTRPEEKAEFIRRFFPDLSLRYSKNVVLLYADALTDIQHAINTTPSFIGAVTQHQGRMDNSAFINMGRSLSESHSSVASSYSVRNPFTTRDRGVIRRY